MKTYIEIVMFAVTFILSLCLIATLICAENIDWDFYAITALYCAYYWYKNINKICDLISEVTRE